MKTEIEPGRREAIFSTVLSSVALVIGVAVMLMAICH